MVHVDVRCVAVGLMHRAGPNWMCGACIGRWSDCSGRVDYSRKDLLTPVLPLYTKFFSQKELRILVYSGDIDGVVPHTGEWGRTTHIYVLGS